MVEFLKYTDIDESTIQKSDRSFTVSRDIIDRYIEETNVWYTEQCLEKGVLEEDIIIYDESIDLKDNRYSGLIKLCEYHFLKSLFFGLWKQADDIYYLKFQQVSKLFDSYLTNLTINKITGVTPAEINTSNDYFVANRFYGDE